MKTTKTYIPIIQDGAIGSPEISDRKIIPILILDCINHPELHNLIEIHQETPPGDVISRWGYHPLKPRHVELNLKFIKPVETEIHIRFDLQTQSIVADSIVQAKAVYLQSGKQGDKVIHGLNKPKIIIEIPPQTKLPKWDEMLTSQIASKIRKEGIKKKEAKKIAKQHFNRTRELLRGVPSSA